MGINANNQTLEVFVTDLTYEEAELLAKEMEVYCDERGYNYDMKILTVSE